MSNLFKAIENDEICFENINVSFNQIKETGIHKVLDLNGRNVLFMTRENPELSMRIIKELNVEYRMDAGGVDTFEGLSAFIIEKYYKLELHKYTTPPKSYFNILLNEEIKDIVCRFKYRYNSYMFSIHKDNTYKNDDLFITHPNILKLCSLEEFKDRNFFKSVYYYPGKIFCGKMYAIEIAIYYGYLSLLPKIPNKKSICLTDCKNWKNMDEENLLYMIKESNQAEDPEDLLKVAFEKFYPRLIDRIFSYNKSDYYNFTSNSKYFNYIGEERCVNENTYRHVLKNYPDYRGFNGYGLLYICLINNFKPFPEDVTEADLGDAQEIFNRCVIHRDMDFTNEQWKFLLSHDYIFSDQLYEYFTKNQLGISQK